MALPLPVPEEVGEHTLRLVAEQACSTAGCVAAGVTVMRPEGLPLIVGTSLLGAQLEQTQWDAGDGPGLDAIGQLQVFNVTCLATARSWSLFVRHAAAHGVRSCLAVPIILRGRALGVLDLYSTEPAGFDGSERIGLHFAGEAAVALSEIEAGKHRLFPLSGPRPEGRGRSRAAS
ncbi:MAG: GAF domain-containing protein [Acidimicrobiales bacterium]